MASASAPHNSGTGVVVSDQLKAHEVAKILGCSVWQATELCRSGALRASKPMKSWLVDPADLQAYLDAHRNTPTSDAGEQVPA